MASNRNHALPLNAGRAFSTDGRGYRVAFRYRYYTAITTIDADLQAFLRFYNYERPHRGYRTKGRTPASLFFSGQPEFLSQMGA